MSVRSMGAPPRNRLPLWTEIQGKPTAFPPAPHRTLWGDIDNKPSLFEPAAHGHSMAQIDGLANALASKATLGELTNLIDQLVGGAPAALNTLKEIADRFEAEDSEQAAFLAALSMRLRFDDVQLLTTQQKLQGRSNLGLGSASTRDESYFAVASAILSLAGNAGLAGTTGGTVGSSSKAAREDHTHPITNVQFTSAVTIGAIITLGKFNKDIVVNGVLATDRLNIMPTADFPAGVDLIGCRTLSANNVRVYLRGLSLLTDNTPYGVAITALR